MIRAHHSDWKTHQDRPRSWLLRIGRVLFSIHRTNGAVSVSVRWARYASGTGYWPDR